MIKRAHVSKQLRIAYGTLFIVEETIATHSLPSLSAEEIQADSNQSCRKSFKYFIAWKFYMEFNFMVSGKTIKLISVNCMEIY